MGDSGDNMAVVDRNTNVIGNNHPLGRLGYDGCEIFLFVCHKLNRQLGIQYSFTGISRKLIKKDNIQNVSSINKQFES